MDISRHSSWIGMLISAISVVSSGYFGYTAEFMNALVTLLVFIALMVGLYTYTAYRAFRIGRPSPFPKGFWSMVFNRLQPTVGGDYSATIQLTVIASGRNERSLGSAREIKDRFDPLPNVFVHEFLLKGERDYNEEREILADQLRKSDGLVIHRVMDLERAPWVYEMVEAWTKRNSHVPCFVMDLVTDEEEVAWTRQGGALSAIHQRYHRISAADIGDLPWKFLSRANERSYGWRSQATTNRSYAMALMGLVLVTGAGAFVWRTVQDSLAESHRNARRSKGIERIEKQTLHTFTTIAGNASDCETATLAFNLYARAAASEYANSVGIADAISDVSLSIWRIRRSSDGQHCIYQIAWDDENGTEKRKVWPYEVTQYIIASAFAHPNALIYWHDKMKDGEPAAWPLDDRKPIAYWKDREGRIEFSGRESDYVSYFPRNTSKHAGIVCLAYGESDSPEDVLCGICLDSKIPDSHFIIDERTRELIKRVARAAAPVAGYTHIECDSLKISR